MSNRVEELESQVAELQAAVDGLTEELVETRERLRQLEESDGVDNSRTPEPRDSAHAAVEHADAEAETRTETDADAEADTDTETDADTDDDGSDSDGNDIIVA
jgi:TolA-binding protein